MASVFTKILRGELPGRFVWRDERAAAFLTIAPVKPGHTLVVPVQEVDHWIDLQPELASHLILTAQTVGQAIHRAFQPTRVGMALVGIEVPHVHLHLIPMHKVSDMNFSKADAAARPEDLDAAAEKIRAALRAAGCAQVAG